MEDPYITTRSGQGLPAPVCSPVVSHQGTSILSDENGPLLELTLRCDLGVQVTLGDNGHRLEALARKMGLTDPGLLVSTIIEYGLDRIESGETPLRLVLSSLKL